VRLVILIITHVRSEFSKISDAIEEGTNLYRLKTEDGIEIRKLYIKLLDPSLGSDEVKFLLSVYGSIDSITIFGKGKHHGWKMRNRGFVTFEKASDASCALINRAKFSELFVMSPADSWIQPDYEKNQKMSTFEEHFNGSELLETLNEDCLLHIFSYLDILDVIITRKVCRLFYELSERHFKSVRFLNFANIKSKKKLTLHEARLVLDKVGHNITKASINSEKFYNQRILNFVPKFLMNLKHLHLTGFKLDSISFWNQMTNILSNLETLDLSDNSAVHEDLLKSLKSPASQLKALNVSNCTINGKFLEIVPNVKSLNISGCRFINGKQMIKYVESNKELKSLNISKCPNFFGKDVNELLQKIPQLEILSLNNYYIDDETSKFVIPSIMPLINLKELTIQNINYPPCDQLLRTINLENHIEVLDISYGNLTLTSVYAISTMKHLKKFVMNFKTSVPEDLIDYLMALDKLEEIHMSSCSYISPANVLRLFLLPKLKFLDISRCYGFSNEFIVEVVERLKEVPRINKCRIKVGLTEIDQKVFVEPELRGCREILEFNWEATKDVEHDYDIDEENKYEQNKTENVNQQEYFSVDGK
jgi:hypothetical protein